MTTNRRGTTWSDSELDEALAGLNNDNPSETRILNSVRTKLFTNNETAADTKTPRTLVASNRADASSELSSVRPIRTRARSVSAAGIIAAGILVFFIPSLLKSDPDRGSATAAASGALNLAASFAVTTIDKPVGPGQYRLIQTHDWHYVFAGDLPDVAMFETTYDVWAPADLWSADSQWLHTRTRTGNRIWVVGNEEQAKANGYLDQVLTDTGTENGTWQAPCGDFFGQEGCNRVGNWSDPTEAFLASLPRDPSALFNRMAQDIYTDKGRTLGPQVFDMALDALQSGLYPADLRAAIYQALTFVDGLDVTSDSVNVDGRAGLGLALDGDGPTRTELVIDPNTGDFIGEREINIDETTSIPMGATIAFTAVRTDVVDEAGQLPPN
ncbi:hypothetical protein EH165_14785 [Nakamurella antarctica]|uniref:CU044_5270 family protein n=1 Tax=Nakamurella antarctica TaxID=1902245 RepID=A0A3G8ZYW4_9ACTN|nr:CU044_5270 family protein [Nakamurella antarctica]AZI59216.1 hypothetical protein EH165_14785 [Nakamurella antarctica]